MIQSKLTYSTPRASTGAFRRGGQFSTRANSGHASNTKGPLRRKTCTPKTAMTPVVATIRLRRSSPRPRGPPSQSESYVWDKALICRRRAARGVKLINLTLWPLQGASVSRVTHTHLRHIARCHRRHADRLREPDSTTLWYLQIGPEVEKIR